ncbi:class III signal peptide-containing protein [Methanocaldococcus sp.]|uniref:class III signal peptide-containing protein n=1 Tax=Methanocaldococcus sp. TaxID=2152917 RepID=UPI00262A512F|nr:class III signal peptide-containing protein [Methanocaldococcus sp.]MCQ6254510.1 class III signal peptide-containing protein [Methanocaldococcus sp.]
MKIIKSNRGQISLEFSLLVMVVIVSALIVSYYLISSAIDVRKAEITTINATSNAAKEVLSTVS